MGFLQYGAFVYQTQTTATSGGTTTLVNTSKQIQVFTGVTTQTIVLPDATTFQSTGESYQIYNQSTGSLTIHYNDASVFGTVQAGNTLVVTLTNNGTSNGTWVTLSTSASGGLFTPAATETIAGGGQITLNTAPSQYVPVAGSGGPVTLSATPFASTPNDGTYIIIEGTSATNTVTLTNNDASGGCILNGNATLGQYDTLTLVWRSALSRYVEITRSG